MALTKIPVAMVTEATSSTDLAASSGDGLVGHIAAGAGAVATTVQELERRTISILDRMTAAQKTDVLSGTGSLDVTAAIQATIDYVETLNWPVTEKGRPAIGFPSGVILSDGVTCNKRHTLIGAGSGATFWHLKPGSSASLITLNAEDVAGTSLDDTNHTIIRGMTIAGNRTDSTTTGTSHGINCTDTAWTQATQYSTAFKGDDLVIYGFTGDGIHLGVNRNWMLLSNTIVRYCNDNGLASYSYDNRIVNCDFGVCKNFGIREYAGGANSFVGCNIFYNTINVVINLNANAPSWFVNCCFDYALQNGVSITGSSTIDAYSFTGCRFYGNSRAGANLYSDISIGTAERIQIVGCQFIIGDQKVKYLIETGGVTQVQWVGNAYDVAGGAVTPYQTGITNDFSKLVYAGGGDAWVGASGSGIISTYCAGVEVMRSDGTFNRSYKAQRQENTNPRTWWVDTDATANEGKWVWNVSGNVMQLNASDDAETGFTTALSITRTGNVPIKSVFGQPVGVPFYAKASLPATAGNAGLIICVSDDVGGFTPAFCDGGAWRRMADRNVIS